MDRNIEAVVIDRVTTAPADAEIICGNSDYTITFSFDDEWEGIEVKTALFKWLTADGVRKHEQPFTGDVVEVPVITDTREVEVGVYAGDLTTTTGAPIRCLPSIRCGSGEKFEPDPDKYDALMELIKDGMSGGLTDEQAADLEANTEARHSHRHQNVLDGLTSGGVKSLKYGGYELAFETDIPKRTSQLQNNSGFITLDDLPESGGPAERPTETKTFLNDFSYEANMDASSVVANAMLICALYDGSNDLSNKEIAKIEYNFDFSGDESKWIDVKDIIQVYPTLPYTINVNRSFRYTDRMGQDCVCFGALGFIVTSGNQFLVDILNQNQYGFRVTYYTD